MKPLELQAGPGNTLAHSTSVDTSSQSMQRAHQVYISIFEAGKEGRKRKAILGDGNCLFRAIAQIIYGTEDNHATVCVHVCQILLTFLCNNRPVLAPQLPNKLKF